MDGLVHRADGLFIYAVTLCRIIMPPQARHLLTAAMVYKAVEKLISAEKELPTRDGAAVDLLYSQAVAKVLEEARLLHYIFTISLVRLPGVCSLSLIEVKHFSTSPGQS